MNDWRDGIWRLDSGEGGDAVTLARTGYVSDLPQDRLAFMGAHIGDHLRATVHNLEGREPYLEQSVYFDDLPAPVADAAREDLRRLGERVLQEAYQRVSLAERADAATQEGTEPTRRLRLGVYYYEEEMPPTATAPAAAGEEP